MDLDMTRKRSIDINKHIENRRVTLAAGIMGQATLVSRILGFIRDMVMAWFFGAGMVSDSFLVAFRIPNLLRRLFAEGTLSLAFVPVFTDTIADKGKEEAFVMARCAMRILAIILVVLTIAGIAAAPWLVRLMAPGFTGGKYELTVLLTRIMFPYVFFVCMVALCMGILNVLGHFAAPAISPALLNIGMISGMLIIAPRLSVPVLGLAIGVLAGGAAQLALQIPFLIKKGVKIFGAAPWMHPGLKRIAVLMGPAVYGAAVYQVNIFISTLLASLLPEGSVSYLYYADRLVQFPLGIAGVSLAIAVLPSLSRQATANDTKGFSETFAHSMVLMSFIMLPAAIGLIMLREPIIRLLFMRGAFSPQDVEKTASALFYYSIGLWAFAAVRVNTSAYYALKDTKTPVNAATLSIVANILCCLALMGPLGHSGLALATTISSIFNLGILLYHIHPKINWQDWKKIIESGFRSMICSLLMGAFIFTWHIISPFDYTASQLSALAYVASAVSGAIVVYIFLAYVVQKTEMHYLFSLVKRS